MAVNVRWSETVTKLLPGSATAFEVVLEPSRRGETARQSEYLAGRACAQGALRRLRVSGSVGRHVDRTPAWPAGAVGSISHCRHFAVAAAAPDSELRALGIDVEEARAVGPELDALLFTNLEQALLRSVGRTDLAALLFSLKESSFKCWYPRMGVFLDFAEVEVTPDLVGGEFRAEVVGPHRDTRVAPPVQGRFSTHLGHIYAAAWW